MKRRAAAQLKSLLQALAFCLAAAFALVVASIVSRHVPGWSEEVVVGAVGVLLTLALTTTFLSCQRKSFDDIGLAPDRNTATRFVIGLALGLTLVALHLAIVAGTGHVSWIRNSAIDARGVVAAALGYGLLALREEIAFRAYPLRTLLPAFGALGAQLFMMAIFVAEHRLGGATWSNAVFGAGLGALVFSMAALATRGIALPFGLHAAWNLGDWMRGGKGDHGLWIMRIEEGHSVQISTIAMVAYASLMLLPLVVFSVLYRRNRIASSHHADCSAK